MYIIYVLFHGKIYYFKVLSVERINEIERKLKVCVHNVI